ncbi:MAG: porin [Pirellulales bacterium]|nr:porin [Pirellulales bacterium]
MQAGRKWAWALGVALLCGGRLFAAEPFPDFEAELLAEPHDWEVASLDESLARRLEEVERQNSLLARQLAELSAQQEHSAPAYAECSATPPRSSGYDRQSGVFCLVRGSADQPFELRADLFTEARYTNFQRNRETWTDSAGDPFPIREFESIEVTRNFIQLSGYALDPNLQFTANIFSSTALNDTLYLGWVNYRFSDEVDVRIGNWLLPGTREWLESFRFTLGADRLMATTFFRPNISPGIWVQGRAWDGVNYVVMLANSINRFTQGVERVGSSKAASMSAWWEPTGDFGSGPSDFEEHDSPSLRLGTSMTFSEEANQAFGAPGINNPEDTILRLSDGTPLFRPNALAPGVQLTSVQVNLWALDAAVKYRGWSLSGEYFWRVLNNLEGSPAPPPQSSIFDHGGLLQGGAMLVSRKLEAFARSSFVTGPFGEGSEYGGGLNWFPRGVREWRVTGEVLQISDSPAQNLLTGYRAGSSGTLYQLQCFIDF